MAQPAALVDENGNPMYGEVPDKEILAHLDRHSKAVMKDFYRTSEYCGACHKAALPRHVEPLQVAAGYLSCTTSGSSRRLPSRISAAVLRQDPGFQLPDLPHEA